MCWQAAAGCWLTVPLPATSPGLPGRYAAPRTGNHEGLLDIVKEYKACKPWDYIGSEPNSSIVATLKAYATGAATREEVVKVCQEVFVWGAPSELPATA